MIKKPSKHRFLQIFFRQISVFWIIVFSLFAQGQAFFDSRQMIPSAVSQTEVKNANSEMRPENNLHFSYARSAFGDSDTINRSYEEKVEAQYKIRWVHGPRAAEGHLIGGVYPGTSFSYFAVPEAYYAGKLKIDFEDYEGTVALGRKKNPYSIIDEKFNLGLVQPTFTQDQLNFVEQGLTGLHVSVGNPVLNIALNYYPVNLPNQGPALTERNGKIVSANRWSTASPDSYVFKGQIKNISYDIESYDFLDLVSHGGYGTSVALGRFDQTGPAVRFGYANTPLNEIVISRTTYADLDLNGSVQVAPTIRTSQKFLADAKYSWDELSFFASFLRDEPKNERAVGDYAVQFLDPVSGYAGGFNLDLTNALGRRSIVGFSYARFFGGGITDVNSDGSENNFTFTRKRLLFRQPYKVTLEFDAAQIFSRSLFVNGSWVYDGEQRGSLISVNARHEVVRQFFVTLGFDVFGVENEDASNEGTPVTNFISKHRSDDRLTGAIEYVF